MRTLKEAAAEIREARSRLSVEIAAATERAGPATVDPGLKRAGACLDAVEVLLAEFDVL
jgi:hypothetical protein